jgi:hypothetical protein
MLWFDLSPMRPADYWNTEARSWIEAQTLQNAYQRGAQRARDEALAIQRLEQDDDE